MKKIKTFLQLLWLCKIPMFIIWAFFYALSFVGQTSYDAFESFLISGAFSVGLTIFSLLCVKIFKL